MTPKQLDSLAKIVDATFQFIEQKVTERFPVLAPVVNGFLTISNQQIDAAGLTQLASYLENHGITFPIDINQWVEVLFTVIEDRLGNHKVVVYLMETIKAGIESVGVISLLNFLKSKGIGPDLVTV